MNPSRSFLTFLASEQRTNGRGWCRWASLLAVAGALVTAGAGAAEPPTDSATQVRATLARLEAHKEALARANAAVVGLQVVAVEDARSIATLGKERQGSGVLIGDDGVVLTIGYLILEADQVELVAGDGRRIPARVVAYDLASGFGLVQALAPLGIAPAPLGVSAAVASDEPLLFASGGDERDLSLARMVSRRPFSGYWEYHIEGALFTAPVRTDHSGAGLFNADGELVGVGSLVVGNASDGSGPAMRGNMFVPVDLLKPILAELKARGSSRNSSRAWLGLNCVEVGGPGPRRPSVADSPAERPECSLRMSSSPSTACESPTWRRCIARCGAATGPTATSSSTSCATARRFACRCMRSTG
jgi:S1-C subfamily serine protease